jgi:hypothetical protein
MPTPKKTAKAIAPAKPVTSDPDVQSLEKQMRVMIAETKTRDFEQGRETSLSVTPQFQGVDRLVIAGKASRAGQSKGGKNRGQDKRNEADNKGDVIRNAATALLSDQAPRYISGILMNRGLGSRPKILRALKSHPSGNWPTRKKK